MRRPGFLAHLLVSAKRHWSNYLTEAAGLFLFLFMASLITTTVHYPGSWLARQLAGQQVLGRALIGLVAGLTVVVIVYSPWGKRSGAHLNPAVTLAFWQLGKIKPADACWYLLAQVVGALLAGQALLALLGRYFTHPKVNYALTLPGPQGTAIAFGAEFSITFGMVAVLLLALHTKRLQNLAGWLLGALLAFYIVVETPYSGMSLNPARSLGSAVAAHNYTALWLYLVAPPLAAWLAAVLFQLLFRNSPLSGSIVAGPGAGSPGTEPPQHPVE
ncbi:aquaporin family protein [Hymenobacter lapidiphilus]|uniref:aquaporin n=1 Tax=Hymenobacter sp. CCM 8763 TaxID=2303334 RepID=UPI000E3412C8|nr:aquaporin [Hymenobacter sp. CCM 8763]RFP64785.1 aquaporin family protein [Hymenobacter sp. CCM 8763]